MWIKEFNHNNKAQVYFLLSKSSELRIKQYIIL